MKRLTYTQKRMVCEALSFRAATAEELASWSGVAFQTIYRIAQRGYRANFVAPQTAGAGVESQVARSRDKGVG